MVKKEEIDGWCRIYIEMGDDDMCQRLIQEQIEASTLSPYSCQSSQSKGRVIEEPACEVRTIFQRDRDRILHSKAFRRLAHKTQVFISPEGDHYRTRLTHTLEVAQISRTIARGLRLNEDLVEAIALGHDLGHTPFGHAGEQVLHELTKHKFVHSEQSLRVVTCLEKDGKGLNLSYEVKDGIQNHRTGANPATLEGKVVQLSDKIAYINHDIDDAIRAKVLKQGDLPKVCLEILGNKSSERINTLITNIIYESMNNACISMSPEIEKAFYDMRKFLFKNVYIDSIAKQEESKAKNVVRQLYLHYKAQPESLPEGFKKDLTTEEAIERSVCDYIAGMTDRYAVHKYCELNLPVAWQIY